MAEKVRVLVVDDSAFARKVLREVVSADEGLEVVGVARDGVDALEQIEALRPDVVTLDLVMPELDGIGVLRALGGRPDAPAVIVVSMADEDSELGVAALQEGAFDVVHKPTALAIDRLYTLATELTAKIREAARAPRGARLARAAAAAPLAAPAAPTKTALVVVGASTGGPQALTRLVTALPADFPVPMCIVLHMPVGYTEAFARRLDAESAASVLEARDALELGPGQVVVARAGVHLGVQQSGGGLRTTLPVEPASTLHRPSVDVLFSSAAAAAGAGVLGVVLTGMGQDGRAGAAAIRAAGGRVFTEAESSCVVYGMPRSVVEAGLSDARAVIGEMAALIARSL